MYVMISQLGGGGIKIRSHDQKQRKTDILNFGDLYFFKSILPVDGHWARIWMPTFRTKSTTLSDYYMWNYSVV